MFFVLSSVEAWGFVRSFVDSSFVGSFVPSFRSRFCFVSTVVLTVEDYRECTWCPCLLRKIKRYEFFRYVATTFPRCFVVAVPLNVEFERSVRILSVVQYFVDDVRRSFRVLLVMSRCFLVCCRRVLGWRCVRTSVSVNSFGCSVAVDYVGPVVFS